MQTVISSISTVLFTGHISRGGWPIDQIEHHLVVSENRKEVECIVAGECGDCITRSPILLQSDGNNATAAEISLSTFLFPNQQTIVYDFPSVQTLQGPYCHFAFKKHKIQDSHFFRPTKFQDFSNIFPSISHYLLKWLFGPFELKSVTLMTFIRKKIESIKTNFFIL